MNGLQESMVKYDTVILDDEIKSVNILAYFLESYCPSINIIEKTTEAEVALECIKTRKPKILFLDMELRELRGFDFLDELDYRDMKVIFVSGFSEYAVDAFQYDAVDFILKPININRVKSAVSKAIDEICNDLKIRDQNVDSLQKDTAAQNAKKDFIIISNMENFELVKIKNIRYLKSDGRYTTLFLTDDRTIVASKNLGAFEKILDQSTFYRIHKSYIINISFLQMIAKEYGGSCILTDGTSLPIARKRKEELLVKYLQLK